MVWVKQYVIVYFVFAAKFNVGVRKSIIGDTEEKLAAAQKELAMEAEADERETLCDEQLCDTDMHQPEAFSVLELDLSEAQLEFVALAPFVNLQKLNVCIL